MKYLLLIIILVACHHNFTLSEYTEQNDNYNYISFTMNSYRKLCTPNNNFVYSPLSLNVIYNILYQSSSGQAELSLHQILIPYSDQFVSKYNILTSQVNSLASIAQNPKIKLANKFYISDNIEIDPDFKNVAHQYQSIVENINFGNTEHARNIMNNWVENRTHGMIKDLIQKGNIDHSTDMVIINTVYFKDEWLKKFTDDKVRDGTFYTYSGPQQTKFLNDVSHYDVAFRPNLKVFVLRILYKNGFEFWIILPMINYSLEKLIQNINADHIYDIKQNFVNKKTEIKFPTFTIENTMDGARPSPDTFVSDDFKLTSGPRRNIGAIIQKTKIIVNSEGTEAASATFAVGVGSSFSMPETPFLFEANRPFLYVVITPNSLKPIFIGHFTAPSS